MHKNTKLLPYQRREVYRRWCQGDQVTDLATQYGVTRKTLYEVFKKAKLGAFENFSSKNLRYRTIEYGMKRLAKAEKKGVKKLGKRPRRLNRYQKEYPGEMVHTDSSLLPLLRGEAMMTPREYLYVFVDDFGRSLFADILPDQTSWSAAIVLDEALRMLPFAVECVYSDNGKEFKKAFRELCHARVYAFVRWYNHVRPHQSLGNVSPMAFLEAYLNEPRLRSKVSLTRY